MNITPLHERYCLPIRVRTFQAADEIIKTNAASTQYFELWLDYIADLDKDQLLSLIDSMPGRIVCLFRRDKLEPPTMEESRRRDLLELLAKLDVLVDLDVSSQAEDVQFFTSLKRTAVFIASYHNYDATPQNLIEILDTMKAHHPEVFKLACFCNAQSDAALLINLKADLNDQQKRSIILGMGKTGAFARLVCDAWGNELVFAPIDEQTATAPGQFTRQQLETLQTILGETS